MSFRWSFSTDKFFRRCQRQFYFAQIAAHHSPKEPWRREAFILKQMKSLELWRGSLIHEGVQHYLVPALRNGHVLDWNLLTEQTIARARAQLSFSEKARYREEGIAKGQHKDFCALIPHENGKGVSAEEFNVVCDDIRIAFQRIAGMTDLWGTLLGRKDVEAEKQIWVDFDGVKIMVQIDLLFERSIGQPTIIDWKSYDTGGDTDARLQTVLYGWALWKSEVFGGLRKAENIELLECQVQSGVIIKHECSLEIFDELEDHIYRSLHRILPLCQSKKMSEARLQDFAFTDNPNSCEYCTFRTLCLERTSEQDAILEMLPSRHPSSVKSPSPDLQSAFF